METTKMTSAEKEQVNVDESKEPQEVRVEVDTEECRMKRQDSSRVDEIKEKLKKPTIGISLVIYLILNTAMFLVGVTNLKDCPRQPLIPIYLSVAGGLGIVTKIMPILNRNKRFIIIDRIVYGLLIVEFIWMILGSYWIYSIYEPNYNPHSGDEYCHKSTYLLAFWLLTLNYIFLLLIITIPCCILCCFCLFISALCSTN